MKIASGAWRHVAILLIGILPLLAGCQPLSEKVTDESAGLNGSFEVAQDGLPVNWIMYTPKTVPDAAFNIALDREIVKEGRQSLRFEVDKCSSRGGASSPGFTNEFLEAGRFTGPGRYRVSFWIRNDGAEFLISAGGVSSMEGSMRVLVQDDSQYDDWTQFEYTLDLPEEEWLGMRLNILKPGTFWIDAVEITEVE